MNKIPRVILQIETSRAFGRGLLYGIARYTRLHEPCVFYREVGGLEKTLPELKGWNPDGIIMRTSPGKEKQILAMGVPVIFVVHLSGRKKHIPSIITDGDAIGCIAFGHLLERGFCHFGFCGLADMHWSQERSSAFSRRVEQAGHACYQYNPSQSPKLRSWKNEQIRLAEWLKSLPKPIGIMTCNDDRGQHLAEACKLAGFQVPDEVAIIGVDNDDLVCDLSDPPLTSIALNTEEAGYRAAELLHSLMQGEKMVGQRIMVKPTHVVTRQSTDKLAIDDPDVAEAIRYIRRNARMPLQVNDVVSEVALSRRVLEKRFRSTLQRSIYQEIRRVRVDQAVKLLMETEMSISDIALALGFPGIEHFARYFRKEKGMSLRAYRNEFKGQ